MGSPRRPAITLLAAALLALPAAAQFSDSYNFIKAVRDRDGDKTTQLLNKGGGAVIDTRDPSTGETALHIVTRNHDMTWLSFLLGRGAQANARDRAGNTPLMVAAQTGDGDATRLLLAVGANPNLVNDAGETPLIRAVQRRDLPLVRQLIAGGADPKLADRIAGKTAADYAKDDSRAAPIAKVLAEAKPKAPSGPIAGPVR